ncbi:MAG: formylmethanofuran dehydrogenase subunit A, partial [Methanosarcinaceae archaeon]
LDTRKYNDLIQKFGTAAYTIKGGEIVCENGEIVAIPERKTYYSDVDVKDADEKEMISDVKDWFRYYSFGFEHYPTPDNYLVNPTPIKVNREQ